MLVRKEELHDRYMHMVRSAIGSGVAELITLPICTLKTVYQNTNSNSILATMYNIKSKYGIRGFYNGSMAAIFSQVLSTSTKYTWYQTLKNIIPNIFVAGVMSGILACSMTHPIDVVKIHVQMNTPLIPEIRKHGPLLFYRGFSKTLVKSSIGSGLFFPLYDFFKKRTDNYITASLFSALISTTILQPVDYMKIRHIYGLPFFSGWHPKPYFKGLSLNLGRVVPHFIITMSIIELLIPRISPPKY